MKQSHWTIYCHIHVESGRRYVGLTKKTWKQRWNQHVYTAEKLIKKGWSHFANAIRKYGPEAFDHNVLAVCDTLEAANAAEERWIADLDTRNPLKGFNLAPGGSHTPHPIKNPWDRPEYRAKATEASRRRAQDPAIRAQLRQTSKEAWNKPGYRERVSAALKDIPLSPEHCVKLSEAGKGKVLSPEVCEKISAAQKGRPRNPESIARSAASRKGIVFSPEHRARIGDAQRGRKLSPEHVAKVAAANRAINASKPKQTHCKSGHSLDDAYVIGKRKFCRPCQHRRSAQYYARRKKKASTKSGINPEAT